MIESNKELINCINVSKRYGYFFALRKISFKIKNNTIFGIAGANGAGKTTLIKILSGLQNPTFGRVIIKGKTYEDEANNIRKIIGIVTDESFLYEELTLFENLKFYDNLHLNFEKESIKTKIERFTKLFNLEDWINEPIRNLSHGMKKKVELIRAFMHQPSLLFLDEPFSGLDFRTTEILINSLKNLKGNENVSIILTTHKIEILTKICDEIIVLQRGKINETFIKDEFNETEIESYF